MSFFGILLQAAIKIMVLHKFTDIIVYIRGMSKNDIFQVIAKINRLKSFEMSPFCFSQNEKVN
jgi:hypothetical protein